MGISLLAGCGKGKDDVAVIRFIIQAGNIDGILIISAIIRTAGSQLVKVSTACSKIDAVIREVAEGELDIRVPGPISGRGLVRHKILIRTGDGGVLRDLKGKVGVSADPVFFYAVNRNIGIAPPSVLGPVGSCAKIGDCFFQLLLGNNKPFIDGTLCHATAFIGFDLRIPAQGIGCVVGFILADSIGFNGPVPVLLLRVRIMGSVSSVQIGCGVEEFIVGIRMGVVLLPVHDLIVIAHLVAVIIVGSVGGKENIGSKNASPADIHGIRIELQDNIFSGDALIKLHIPGICRRAVGCCIDLQGE